MKHEDQQFLSGLMDGEWRELDVRRSIADVCADEALRAKWARYHLARHAMQRESVVAIGSIAERVAAAVAAEPAHSNVTAIGGGPAIAAAAADDPAGGDAAAERAADASEARDTQAVAAAVAPIPTRSARTRTFAAGFGLAASVAAVTALGLNALDVGAPAGDASGTSVRVASSEPVTPEPLSVQVPGAPLPRVELVANTFPSGAYWTDAESAARRADSQGRLNMMLSQHIENSPTAERQGMLPYSRLVGFADGSPRLGARPEGSSPGR